MLKTLHLLTCSCLIFQALTFDFRLITAVRHGIEKNLGYISQNYEKMNEDCYFGLALATAVLKDAYKNGSHIMDLSTLKLLVTSSYILQKGIPTLNANKNWAKYILDPKIWTRKIEYKYNTLDSASQKPDLRILKNIYRYYYNFADEYPNSDVCLQNVVNSTLKLTPIKCYINRDCWKKYYNYDTPAFGYILTHKLLILQLSKARNCILSKRSYEAKTNKLCSRIYSEVISTDYFNALDDIFDLFLEEVFLCGVEGYTEFFKTKWLLYILKSQKHTGCFPAYLGDPLKSRMKRNTNILLDGCADHTTGLGAAVLSLYYNFIINGNMQNVY